MKWVRDGDDYVSETDDYRARLKPIGFDAWSIHIAGKKTDTVEHDGGTRTTVNFTPSLDNYGARPLDEAMDFVESWLS